MSLYVYVDNVDEVFQRAVAAGAEVVWPVQDAFWGDRCGTVRDPEGHKWSLATHKANPTMQEMIEARQRMIEAMQARSTGAAD